MPLAAGTRLGPHEILAPLGAGGMGEVYRARDSRIGREVALKVLPPEFAADPERLLRFKREAHAAGALNHPNLLTLYELGDDSGRVFLVTELLEGRTLRDRLGDGSLPYRKAIGIAVQIARGLAAAHEKGIAHRDLKPENLFVTGDGRVKILDFGLARQIVPLRGEGSTANTLTESGVILGTAGYMAPEQVRGEKSDTRADLFAFGCVLYEMLSGRRAFAADSAIGTMSAILSHEPPPLRASRPDLPEAIERVVAHCLEKDPARRFQSASDLAFQLEGIASETHSPASRAAGASARVWAGATVLLLLAGAGAWFGLAARQPPAPAFERLSFRRGSISAARYSSDGKTIVYSAAWDGASERIYATRLDSRESSPLGLPEARLLAVSASGELAIAVGSGTNLAIGSHTTLARVPLAGGAPRALVEDVIDADWSPDGADLAVVRFAGNPSGGAPKTWLEYPIGRKIYESDAGIVSLRVSPGGDRVALIEQATSSDFSRGGVVVVDRAGHARKVTGGWEGIGGMAWSRGGNEVWYTAVHRGSAKELRAVSLDGHDRLVLNAPGALTLQDVGRDGHVLITHDNIRISTMAMAPGLDRERDLSWQEVTGAADLSPDGRTLVFTEWGEAAAAPNVIGMRGTDGSPVVKLGEGYAGGLSPDGRWVVGVLLAPKPHISIIPTGAGQSRDLDPGPVRDIDWSCWAPDGSRVLFLGLEPGHGYRAYVQAVNGGVPRAFTPDGTSGGWHMVSPDGRWLLATASGAPTLFPLDGGPTRSVPGLRGDDDPIRWTADGRSLLLRPGSTDRAAQIERLEVATGARRPVRTIMPTDPAGVTGIHQIVFTPDLRVYVYSFTRQLSDLYQVTGLR